MHPAEAERRAIYIGLAFILVGVVVLLVRWNPLGIKSPFTTHASNPRLKTDAKYARLSGFFSPRLSRIALESTIPEGA